ncbi:ribonuclease H-like domain-containing protein [Chungangia koreensis]|uniref:Ribonuclease H-like domain-containing protein n=1 Tax=Chungangia koreensis TaxID=752657 RepID=A0ABV8X8H4_9LACT
MSYENKLLQMKSLLKKAPIVKEEKKQLRKKPVKPEYTDRWIRAGLESLENDYGLVFRKKTLYPLDHVHGNIQLNGFHRALDQWHDAGEVHPFHLTDDEEIVFFDTETTGLKGTGTLIFLIGFLRVREEAVELVQYVLADPANEAAFLFETDLWKKPMTLVSYNGKSFDWPQIETRWTLNRNELPKLKEHRHVDLLVGTRRMWKDEMERFKLTKVEEEKLGFHRKGDIPGHLAPVIYMDAVKSGNPELLMKVLKHNEWDILSLLTLFIQSTSLLLSEPENESAVTYTNIGKWYADLKVNSKGKDLFLYVTESFSNDTSYAFYYLGYQLKREKRYKEAAVSFQHSLEGLVGRKKIDAYIELSKIYEHQFKDFLEASRAAESANELAENHYFPRVESREKLLAELNKRLVRLEMKKVFPGEAQCSTGNGENSFQE